MDDLHYAQWMFGELMAYNVSKIEVAQPNYEFMKPMTASMSIEHKTRECFKVEFPVGAFCNVAKRYYEFSEIRRSNNPAVREAFDHLMMVYYLQR